MIPAKITSLNPVQVTYEVIKSHSFSGFSKFIADVENVYYSKTLHKTYFYQGKNVDEECIVLKIELNQSCFIEPTGEGKCRIIKL